MNENEHVCAYCGAPASHQTKSGKWCCCEERHRCPEVRRKNSEGVRLAHKSRPSWYLSGHHRSSKKGRREDRIDFACKFCGGFFIKKTKGFRTYHEKHCSKNPDYTPAIKHHHSDETKKRLSECAKQRHLGGYECGCKGGHGKRGYYKGFYCMSSWELAFVYYHLYHHHSIEQCKEHFEYMFNGKSRKYTPDFKIDGVYYEIKNYMRPETQSKIDQFPKEKTLIVILGKEDNKKYIDFIVEKEGPDFCERLYE